MTNEAFKKLSWLLFGSIVSLQTVHVRCYAKIQRSLSHKSTLGTCRQPSRTRCYVSTSPDRTTIDSKSTMFENPSDTNIEHVDFWGKRVRMGDDAAIDSRLPHVANLDPRDGPLPPGAYLPIGAPELDPKMVCRITLAVDWSQDNSKFETTPLDIEEVTRQIHACIESGFQSFQIVQKGNDTSDLKMLGQLLRDTPKFMQMHWAIRFQFPKQVSHRSVKESVFDILSLTNTDALDTIIVLYDSSFALPYHLEILDAIRDLQRDGMIRSIAVDGWSSTLVQEAKQSGFLVDIQQQEASLLLPPRENCNHDTTPSSWWKDPLVSCLLSEAFLGSRDPPTWSKGWDKVKTWYERQILKETKTKDKDADNRLIWMRFKDEVLDQLRYIGRKHDVCIRSVALRWALQHDEAKGENSVSSVVVPLEFVREPEDQLRRNLRELREVFRFELDEEDLDILKTIECRPKPEAKSIRIDEVDIPVEEIPLAFLEEFQQNGGDIETEIPENEDGYPEIDFSNPALWL